jgi:hypothetical protein
MAGAVEAEEAIAGFRAVLSGVDPSGLTGEACVGLVRSLALVEKSCALVRARLAGRVAATGAHERRRISRLRFETGRRERPKPGIGRREAGRWSRG